jgi:hypothetical protein
MYNVGDIYLINGVCCMLAHETKEYLKFKPLTKGSKIKEVVKKASAKKLTKVAGNDDFMDAIKEVYGAKFDG